MYYNLKDTVGFVRQGKMNEEEISMLENGAFEASQETQSPSISKNNTQIKFTEAKPDYAMESKF